MAGNGNGSPLIIQTGNYVTLQCQEGSITIAGTQECSNTDNSQTICQSSGCNLSLSGAMDTGKTFGNWKAVADGGTLSVRCSTCMSTTLSTSDFWEGSPPVLYECTANPQVTLQKGSPTIQNGYRQAWVNWTDSNGYSTMFQWGVNTSYGFPVPKLNGMGVNLNALQAGTTYRYQITDYSNCGAESQFNGTFTTPGAPTNQFVGWVYSELTTPNPYYLNQVGNPLQSIQMLVSANCYDEINTPVVFPVGTTNSTGYYNTALFPLSTTDYIGPGEIQFQFVLGSNGVCTTTYIEGQWYGINVQNRQFNLTADGSPSWWSQQWYLPDLMTSSIDYREFVLPYDTTSAEPVGLALSNAGPSEPVGEVNCEFGYAVGYQESVNSFNQVGFSTPLGTYFNGEGSTFVNTMESGYSTSYLAEWNQPVGMELVYVTSGVVGTPLSGSPSVNAGWIVPGRNVSYNPIAFRSSEWLSPPPKFNGSAAPPQYTPYPATFQQNLTHPDFMTVQNITSYSSTNQTQVQIGPSFSIDGQTLAGQVGVGDTTAVTKSQQITASCELANPDQDPNQGEALYYLQTTGGNSGSPSAILHFWFMGYCWPTANGPEPKCN
ncbi:MAG TPA: hypothetical protein VEH57_04130 [Thermoplasmata archaeon]|nr:hypothetical protein [Thermoplasmata archaeon]